MGCMNTKEQTVTDQRPLNVRYAASGLIQPFSADYENEFEKSIFYAINMLRSNPKAFITHVQRVYQKGMCKGSKSLGSIINKLKTLSALSSVKFDDKANAAVRANNQDITSRAEDQPTAGGNLDKLRE